MDLHAVSEAGRVTVSEKEGHASKEEHEDYDHLVKVILVGAASVGKTCLINRLFSDKFDPRTAPTIGCDFRFKRYKVDGRSYGVTIWDTAGSERFASVTANYYRGAHGIIYVFDVTRRETLDALEHHWLREVQQYGNTPAEAVQLIVGNKIDLQEQRQVSPEEGAAFARRHNCMYQETSAANDVNVYESLVWCMLISIIDNPQLLKSYGHERLQLEQAAADDQQQQPRRGCC